MIHGKLGSDWDTECPWTGIPEGRDWVQDSDLVVGLHLENLDQVAEIDERQASEAHFFGWATRSSPSDLANLLIQRIRAGNISPDAVWRLAQKLVSLKDKQRVWHAYKTEKFLRNKKEAR